MRRRLQQTVGRSKYKHCVSASQCRPPVSSAPPRNACCTEQGITITEMIDEACFARAGRYVLAAWQHADRAFISAPAIRARQPGLCQAWGWLLNRLVTEQPLLLFIVVKMRAEARITVFGASVRVSPVNSLSMYRGCRQGIIGNSPRGTHLTDRRTASR